MTLPFNIATIQSQLNQALTFIQTYTRNTFPLFCSTRYLAPNAFHRVAGRQDYFDTQCGTSEAASILSVACWQAFKATNNNAWRTLGINFTDAYANYFYYDNIFTTVINQGNPKETPLARTHWLIVCYENVVSEGLQSENDPFNFGYFSTITFTNGIAQLDADLSKVYKVYQGELAYKNVFAPLKSGTQQTIDYYVRNGFRIFANGSPNQSTVEPNGRVKLVSNVSGTYQIVYVRRNGVTINPPTNIRQGEGLMEPYPLLYPCKASGREFSGFAADTAWWSFEAYELAHEVTGDAKYLNAANVTKWNTVKYLIERVAESFFYRKETSSEPLRYPGSYLIQTNSGSSSVPSGYVASRETTVGAKKDFLKLVVNAVGANQFPTMELQNYVTQVFFDPLVNIFIETAINTSTVLEIKISLATNSNDFSKEWIAYWLVNGDSNVRNISFNNLAFLKAKNTTIWFTAIAQTPVYVYNTASWSYQQDFINGCNTVVTQIVITNATGGSGLINFRSTNKIPSITYNLSGNCRVRIVDNASTAWYINLPSTGGTYQTFSGTWQSIFNTTDKQITEIVFENTANQVMTLRLFYLGEYFETLPTPTTVYKTSVVCKLQSAYQWWIGDFKPVNNSLDKVPYTPGAIPFTVNTLNNVLQFQDKQFYMAYQSPYSLSKWGFKEYAKNVVKMLTDSQESYKTQSINRLDGLLHQVYLPYDVGNIPYVGNVPGTDIYDFNKFSWLGLDPNTQWAPYCFRAMEDLARYYFDNRDDSVARKVLINFIKFIDKWNTDNNNSAITNIIPVGNPQALYPEPHLKAIEGLTMLYCNISGLEPEITYKGIQNAFNYVNNQFVATGNMAGCWCKDQPNFTNGGQTYKEFFSFWQGKIIEFYSKCLLLQSSIIIPGSSNLPIFPLDFCNSPAHFIETIKEADFPIDFKTFRDGSNQRIILNDNPVGKVIRLRYEKLNETLTNQLIDFYFNCLKTSDGYFQFPTSFTYNDLQGRWLFVEEPKINPFLSNSQKGLFNISLTVESV